ncbi:MAG: sugar ABC transporter ATP-binding protein [Actinomycetota bacterium]|nr:sugar ABC transporter ATP-binding protein [Actinomycetota bacterium]MDA3028602.1 sugar ABC transporter ATP-binding protein [Actinomycetota bacterium]
MPLVQVSGLVKTYPGVIAVDGVDLGFDQAEITGLVGKNGAGKSTLIQILAGAVQPTAGTIAIAGEEVSDLTPHEANRRGMSFVHQQTVGVPDVSVAENVELGLGFPRRFGFVDWKRLNKRAQILLDRLGASIDPRALFGSLSVAEQRMVMVARALAWDAKLLVLDEPTASLTDNEISHLFTVLRQLRADGAGVVFVSHRLDEVLDLCDRTVVMRDGVVVDDTATKQTTRPRLIEEISGTGHERAAQLDQRTKTRRRVGDIVLEVENLSDGRRVHEVSLHVRSGEILGLGGLAGSGRTELVRLIYGADRPTSGNVFVYGKALTDPRPRSRLKAGIALLPEDRERQGTIVEFSVSDNITLPSLQKHRRLPNVAVPLRSSERTAAQRMIDQLAIKTPSPQTNVGALSGGNRQKVMLAKWLEHGADVYIFDEPSHGVDVDGKEDIYALMERLADDGKAVIFISSEFNELVGVCDRICVLREGRVVGELKDGITERAIVDLCYSHELNDPSQ